MLSGLGWHDRVLDVLEVVRLDRPVCPCAGRSTLLDDFGHTTWNHARKSGFGSNAQSGPSRGRFSTPAADPAVGFFVIRRFDRHEAANSNLCAWFVAV